MTRNRQKDTQVASSDRKGGGGKRGLRQAWEWGQRFPQAKQKRRRGKPIHQGKQAPLPKEALSAQREQANALHILFAKQGRGIIYLGCRLGLLSLTLIHPK